jgi:hypothetical protein
MTWTPKTVLVTRWVLRCDGALSSGQCEQLVLIGPYDDPDARARLDPRLWSEPALETGDEAGLRWDGWLVLRDGRVLCPAHVLACERQVRAALEGLPFPDTHPEDRTRAGGSGHEGTS